MSVSCKTPRFGQLGLGGWETFTGLCLVAYILCVIPPTVTLHWEVTFGQGESKGGFNYPKCVTSKGCGGQFEGLLYHVYISFYI